VNPSATPLTDDETKAQIVDLAKEIVAVAALQGTTGGYGIQSCNDQGDPPYLGQVDLNFQIPADVDENGYLHNVAAAMTAHGWAAGSAPGRYLAGITLNKNGVTASIGPNVAHPHIGNIELTGQCRDMTDHHHQDIPSVDITAELH